MGKGILGGVMGAVFGSADTQTTVQSQEEKDLIEAQKKAIEQSMEIAESQLKFSKADRKHYEDLFRNRDGKSIEEVLMDDVEAGNANSKKLLSSWTDSMSKLDTKALADSGIALNQFMTESTAAKQGVTDYKKNINDISNKMGTADKDIQARVKANSLAGISQAYNESRQQMDSEMARRGLAGSGIDNANMMDSFRAEANAKASANQGAYQQAVSMSDVRRLQQGQLAGQSLNATQMNQGISGQMYDTQMNNTSTNRNLQANTLQQGMQFNAATQQQSLSGIGQVMNAGNSLQGMGQQYLGQANAGIANASNAYGGMANQMSSARLAQDAQFNQAAQASHASNMGILGSLVGAAGAYAAGGKK